MPRMTTPTAIFALMMSAAIPFGAVAQTATPPAPAPATGEAPPADAAPGVPAPAAPAPADAPAPAPATDPTSEASVPPAPAAPVPPPPAAGAAPAPGAPPAPPAPDPHAAHAPKPAGEMKSIAAGLHNAKDEQIGTVTISDTASGALEVKISAKGIEPGERAVHIHEFGKCEVPKFETAGGHLAGGKEHGAHSPGGMHSGDLPNVTADAEGNIEATFFTNNVTIDEIMDADGGSFIIHAGADDYTSQPSGDAGDRFACGVFEPSKG